MSNQPSLNQASYRFEVEQSLTSLCKAYRYITDAMTLTDDIATDIASLMHDKSDDRLNACRAMMRELGDMEGDVKQFEEATRAVMSQATPTQQGGQPTVDLLALLDGRLTEQRENRPSIDQSQHKSYVGMEQHIQDILNPTAGEDEDDSAPGEIRVDDDLAITQSKLNTRCPYTGQEMVDPVKNTHCGHSYERSGILTLISHRGQRARCPVSGCANEKALQESDLQTNDELKRFIEKRRNKK